MQRAWQAAGIDAWGRMGKPSRALPAPFEQLPRRRDGPEGAHTDLQGSFIIRDNPPRNRRECATLWQTVSTKVSLDRTSPGSGAGFPEPDLSLLNRSCASAGEGNPPPFNELEARSIWSDRAPRGFRRPRAWTYRELLE